MTTAEDTGTYRILVGIVQEIRTEVREMRDEFRVTTRKLDQHDTHRETQGRQIDDHEARIRGLEGSALRGEDAASIKARVTDLEKFKWLLVGAALLGGGAAGSIAHAFLK